MSLVELVDLSFAILRHVLETDSTRLKAFFCLIHLLDSLNARASEQAVLKAVSQIVLVIFSFSRSRLSLCCDIIKM